MNTVNIPNILTSLRIIIVPIFVMALIYGKHKTAFILFIIATITDALDGMIARKMGQKTELGAFLDPLADKAILMTSFIIYSYLKWIPNWLTIIVISRDLIVVLGWVLLYIIYGRTKVEVVYMGKIAIACQFILISYTLASINFKSLFPPPTMPVFVIVGAVSALSGIQYIYNGLTQQNEKT